MLLECRSIPGTRATGAAIETTDNLRLTIECRQAQEREA
jgi:hypothetical protein